MGILKKLFNSENKYYLELDEEAQDSQPVKEEVVATANKITDAVPEKAAEVAESQPVQEAVETGKQVIDEAQEKLQSATGKESQPEKKAAKAKSDKIKTRPSKKAAKVSSPDTTAKPETEIKNSGASSDEPPFWVAVMYKSNQGSSGGNSSNGSAEQTFATDNLMPTITKYRRRPGPSLNKFKDMASKTRTPRR